MFISLIILVGLMALFQPLTVTVERPSVRFFGYLVLAGAIFGKWKKPGPWG